MKTFTSSVSPKGQITIPAEVRRLLGLKPKDKVAILVEDREVKLTPASSRLAESFQAVPPLRPSRTWQQVTEIAAEDHAEEVAKKIGGK